jgi:hypothetical protein
MPLPCAPFFIAYLVEGYIISSNQQWLKNSPSMIY